MCRFAVIVAIVLCASSNLLAQTYSYAHGKRFAVTVTDEAVMKAPAWKVDADDPPLAARKAMKIANEALPRLLPDAKKGEFKFRELSLCPHSDKGWYWEVLYCGNSFTGIAPAIRIVVLMDGSVVEPVATKSKDP